MRTIIGHDGKSVSYFVEDKIELIQSNLSEKKLCWQKLRFSDDRVEYKLCYFMRNRNHDGWLYGRFSALVPSVDMKKLLAEAQKRGWF